MRKGRSFTKLDLLGLSVAAQRGRLLTIPTVRVSNRLQRGCKAVGLDCASPVQVTYHIDTLGEKMCIRVLTNSKRPSSGASSQR
jgi:hypothetical protein